MVQCSKNGNVFNFEKAAGIYTSLIDDFFDEKLTWDYFKEKRNESQSKGDKKALTEKCHQQMLFSKYFGNDENYLFVDMEYAIPRKDKLQKHFGSPDCIALKMDNGMPAAIMLVEVKSTKAACTGKSGIDMHPKS